MKYSLSIITNKGGLVMRKNFFLFVAVITLLFISFAGSPAIAKWPKKPIIVVVPWPAANDPSTMVSSALVKVMSKDLGVPVKVINKAGGRGILGTNFVAKSKPDGYTIALSSIGPMLTQIIRGVTPYSFDDFECLGLVWASPFTLAARGDAPFNNLKELAEYGKKHELKLGHWGLGAVPTLIAMNIATIGGFKWKETAFKKVNALLLTSGDVDVITCSTPSLMDYIKTKQVKILAVMSPVHYPCCPEVKTVSEQGFGKDYLVWFGIFVRKGTPKNICKRLEESWFKAMEDPMVKKVIKNVGVVVIKMRSAQAKKQITDEKVHFTKIMKELHLIKKKK